MTITRRAPLIGGIVLGLAPVVPADVRYTVQDLGRGEAYDINNLGQVAGSDGQHGYLWSDGRFTSLADNTTNFSFPRALNEQGQVVGFDHKAFPDGSNPVLALLYDNGAVVELNTRPSVHQSGLFDASDINDAGQIVGSGQLATGYHAFLLDGSALTDLGPAIATQPNQPPAAVINNHGDVVVNPGFRKDPVLYHDGQVTTLPDSDGPATAWAINDAGDVVGSFNHTGTVHAFLYRGGMFADLGSIGTASVARDVNNSDVVVGQTLVAPSQFDAFVYAGNDFADLNSLIDPSSGWRLISATAINDSGQIVGFGTNAAGAVDGFLLDPVPEPGSLTALLFGWCALARRRRRWVR